jgi:glutathione-specific gamma-glutamylcyclotransferase
MWQEWAGEYAGNRVDLAVLRGYRRAFNKASTRNWGSKSYPCPTLGLEPDESSQCVGTVFEFHDDQEQAVLAFLQDREGRDFSFPELDVSLPSGATQKAFVPMNDPLAKSYLGNVLLHELAASTRSSQGKSGRCIDYVANLRNQLEQLGIKDSAVEDFYRLTRVLLA